MHTTLKHPTRHSQRTLLILLVAGALLSIMLASKIFPGRTETPENHPVSAQASVKGEKFRTPATHSGKSAWEKFTASIKQGRNVPACTNAQRSLNQCR